MKLRYTRKVRDKIWIKHQVRLYEVREALEDPRMTLRYLERDPEGRIYKAVGRTEAGRYLRVIFISKASGNWLKTALDAYAVDRREYTRK